MNAVHQNIDERESKLVCRCTRGSEENRAARISAHQALSEAVISHQDTISDKAVASLCGSADVTTYSHDHRQQCLTHRALSY